jgi:hypothetical protein
MPPIHYGAYDKKKSDTSQEMSTECDSSGAFVMLLYLDLNFQMISKKYINNRSTLNGCLGSIILLCY